MHEGDQPHSQGRVGENPGNEVGGRWLLRKKPLENALKCFVKMIVLTMVRLASSDFWKAPLTRIEPVGSC